MGCEGCLGANFKYVVYGMAQIGENHELTKYDKNVP
jgi:hypothetical protein